MSDIIGTRVWGRSETPVESNGGAPEKVSKIQASAIKIKCIFGKSWDVPVM